MTAITRQRGRAALAVGTVLSLGVLGAVATSTAANAASIDTTQQGSIIIHKYENLGDGTKNPDGSGGNPTTDPIKDVVFEYCPITDINLLDGTNTGWDALNAIPLADKIAAAPVGSQLPGHTLGACTPMAATDASGTSTSAKLPLGAYFVREVSAPTNVVQLSTPFVIALPTPKDPKSLTGDWQYDVNVYPKNTVAEKPVKNVVNQPTNGGLLGAPVEYQVTQLVPALAAGQTYTKFTMTDTLDTKLTPNTSAPVTVKAINSTGTTSFVSGTDYTATWSGQKLTVTFLQPGLDKLKAGDHIVFDFQATPNAAGTIDNTAAVNLNDFTLTPGTPNGPDGSPTNTTTTRWGSLNFTKVNASNTADGLAGAKFEVYMGTTDQQNQCTADITGLNPVTVPGSTTPYVATSGSNGVVSIAGLWVGDTEMTVAADGTVSNTSVAGHDFTQRCYVLKEIQAPNGFVLPTGTAALTAVMVKAGDNGTTSLVDIKNTQQGVPELPFTGSNVQVALTIGGIALLVIALGGVMIVRRRNTSRENA
ncbi:SpaH/EbpB family LPXTG-anchored major pilin [Leifsonia xyli]|uniref:SpaH/EbpB family LPXTG-anchored major pilin n=1 Tax=Leifsonia xyli TaxID=1575 RepID=UPI003D67E2A0